MQFRPIPKLCAVTLLILLTIRPAAGAEWNYGTTLGLSSNWNDNPALTNDTLETDSTFRLLATYESEFERQSDANSFNVRPRVTTDYYPDSKNSDLQATDYFFPGSFSYRRPLSSWSLGFNASQQSVLSDAETTAEQPLLIRADDTLTRLSLTPSMAWTLSEKDEILFGLNYGISDYDFTTRADTTAIGGNLSYSRRINERHAVGASGLISSSDSDRRIRESEITTDTTSSYITADYDYTVTENSILSISYGAQDATTETNSTSTIQDRSTGSLDFSSSTYNITYQTELQRGNFSIAASRDVTLDITSGQPQDRYQIAFDGEYGLTEKLLGSLRILGWKQEAVAAEIIDENNQLLTLSSEVTYASAELMLDWTLTRKWYLNSRYEYRWRDTDQSINEISRNLTANSNLITLGVSYKWKVLPSR
jgi:hypothetical protein